MNVLRKSILYSQNFLRDSVLIEQLVKKALITQSDVVYEIGAGNGIITEVLAKYGKKIIAIEVDESLAKRLESRFENNSSIEVQLGNFLNYKLPKSEYKIFSNIPFNITADIIRKVTETEAPPLDCFLIVQKEAGFKYLGKPYASETQFSVLIKPFFDLKILYEFKRSDFEPKPQVDTVLLQIQKKDNPLVTFSEQGLYRDFIVYCFKQWKPTLREGLADLFTKEQFFRLAKDLSFNLNSTPTDLGFTQWLGLFKYFLVGVDPKKKHLVIGSFRIYSAIQGKLSKIHRTQI